jgi:NADP-dependent 3-hydroxy acid dehydrogenase YdfG
MPRTAVIFGALSAIGHAQAEAFARQGALLVVAARDVDSLDDVASRCHPFGTEAVPVSADTAKLAKFAALTAAPPSSGVALMSGSVMSAPAQ